MRLHYQGAPIGAGGEAQTPFVLGNVKKLRSLTMLPSGADVNEGEDDSQLMI